MDTDNMEREIIAEFPNLATEGFQIVGDATTRYNCVAYAVGDDSKPW